MFAYERVKKDPDVLNSLRFYVMLAIVMGSLGYGEDYSGRALNEFIKEGIDWHNNSQRVKDSYIDTVYKTLPAEFLRAFHLTIPGGPDGIKFMEKKHWKRR